MKRIILIIYTIISLTFISSTIKAEDFYEAEYIDSYVKKVKNGKTYYLQMQVLREKEGNKLVYCLEPFEFFEENTPYNKITNIYDYKLSKEQIEKIEKIAYYGYGYLPRNRRTYSWYIVTQVLIWQEVDKEADIFFTKTLNGERDDEKYKSMINELKLDISIEGILSRPNREYKVESGKDLNIPLGSRYYNIVSSDYDYNQTSLGLDIYNITRNGEIKAIENANSITDGNTLIFESVGTQDILIAGIPNDRAINVSIKILKGDITLNINKDNDIYTKEAKFDNTCYIIKNSNGEEIEKVCVKDKTTYKTNEIPYGNYTIEQISNGIGYIKDNNIYEVSIDENNPHPIVNLDNKLIKNKIDINKKYCKNNICSYEKEATFEVYDINNDLVGTYKTDNKGNLSINLGYGHYIIIQKEGLAGYELSESIEDFIKDNITLHYYELYDNYVEEKQIEPPVEEKVILEKEEIKTEPIIITEEKVITEIVEVTKEVPIIQEVIKEVPIIEEMPPNTSVYKVAKKYITIIVDRIKRIVGMAIIL